MPGPVQDQALIAAGEDGFAAAERKAGHAAGSRTATALVLIGACALVLGALVYLTDRHASASIGLSFGVAAGGPYLFGAVGAWLPSFVHPFAFSLFSAATRPASAVAGYRACVGWWAVNVVFEVAQHPSLNAAVAHAIEQAWGRNGFTRPLTGYVLRGTFDVGDLVAATAGALVAAQVLALARRWAMRHGQSRAY